MCVVYCECGWNAVNEYYFVVDDETQYDRLGWKGIL